MSEWPFVIDRKVSIDATIFLFIIEVLSTYQKIHTEIKILFKYLDIIHIYIASLF